MTGHEGFTYDGGLIKLKAVAIAARAAGMKRSEFMVMCEDAKRGEFFLSFLFIIPSDFHDLKRYESMLPRRRGNGSSGFHSGGRLGKEWARG